MTEEEAKTFICPILLIAGVKDKHCKASECILWRWVNNNQLLGYCGLGGKMYDQGRI